VQRSGASQKTCRISLYYFLLSGKIAKVNCTSLSFIFPIKQKACKLKSLSMDKICPNCNKSFVCRNDNILECWCLMEPLSASAREHLADNFVGCLCPECIDINNKSIIHNHQPQIIIKNERP
jgi:hypothetical protein